MTIEELKHKILFLVCKKDKTGFHYRYNEEGKKYYLAPAFSQYNWNEVKEPITRQQVINWVRELRSGKYEQGEGRLREDSDSCRCYCCLGVYAESEGRLDSQGKFVIPGQLYNQGGYLRTYDLLPTYHVLPQSLQHKLANMNDIKIPFEGIANYLEEIFAL